MIMKISMAMCKQPLPPSPALDFPPARFDRNMLTLNPYGPKDKVVVIMGATGTGKSRLSVDLATRFRAAEIINSDKIQVHQGLDIVTNKITSEESCGVPHHLLGVLLPEADLTAANYRQMANLSIESILNRGKLPIIVGGSNSYMEALVDDEDKQFRSRYDCCFLWVDVALPVLHGFVSERVDKMVENGMVEEVREIFDYSDSNYSRGIKKAIGVPEFDRFFRNEQFLNVGDREELLRKVVEEIKRNTFGLACRQREKIERLRKVKKWCIQRLDATPVFTKRRSKMDADVAWERLVAGPSTVAVSRFLLNIASGRPLVEASTAVAAARERDMSRCLVA
ncbi:PREDICTED: adenylate isopentenyltransferase 3, chloroplastic-like [Camelina sativa]|uniref:Adenylate isopentenyltransferase 3, chloroplastic-like n=1 Tax=Camelina sativa TaxID=90675 RepID=A0ABM0SLY6_CAMSA|nr:PREDICTED: adenylate isopentenyltransferase 3, chloroplastic-like [Camelina sativa]